MQRYRRWKYEQWAEKLIREVAGDHSVFVHDPVRLDADMARQIASWGSIDAQCALAVARTHFRRCPRCLSSIRQERERFWWWKPAYMHFRCTSCAWKMENLVESLKDFQSSHADATDGDCPLELVRHILPGAEASVRLRARHWLKRVVRRVRVRF